MEARVTCPACGKSVALKKFCVSCGANLDGVQSEAPKTPVVEQAIQTEAEASPAKTEAEAPKMITRIAPVETIVNNIKIDFPRARTIAEERKLSFFSSAFGLKKPKPEEISIDSIAAGYEVFLRVKGSYHVDYYRVGSYTIPVDEQVKEVIILGHTSQG
jgi:hypothetical protein